VRNPLHVISKKRLREFWSRHVDSQDALMAWYRVAVKASWKSLEDIRRSFPSTDYFRGYYIFDIRGNRYRLMVRLFRRRLYVKHVLTHAEYDKGQWK
jgi:mRNA interferase HigB